MALVELHTPNDEERFQAARRRFALEPLLALQAQLWERRSARRTGGAVGGCDALRFAVCYSFDYVE